MILEKEEKLIQIIKSYSKVAIAFSGGVDSTLLLKMCFDTIGKENVIALTAKTSATPERENDEARAFCSQNGITQIEFFVNQMEIEGFSHNPINRCYLCKKVIFKKMLDIAKEYSVDTIFEGSNMDDTNDYRPGALAIKELGIISPLQDVGLTKAEIREISSKLKLPTASKPSFACLATRFEYNQEITAQKLDMVDKAEQLLIDFGCNQVRVRFHNNIARIEVTDNDIDKVIKNRMIIDRDFKSFGFDYVSLDLKGYETGSMNKNIKETT